MIFQNITKNYWGFNPLIILSLEGGIKRLKGGYMKRYPLQIICNSEEEREQLKKAFLLLKIKTGERTAQTIIKLGGKK